MELQTQVGSLIPTIQSLTLENMQLNTAILQKEIELKQSPIYLELQELKNKQELVTRKEEEIRNEAKQIMLEKGVKKLTMLDGTEIQLNATPGAIVIEDEGKVPEKYWKEKTTRSIDKIALKKDFNSGVPLDPSIYIESTYNLVIK